MAGAGRIGASQDLPIKRAVGQLLQREIEQLQVIEGVARARIPRPEDPGQDPRPQVTYKGGLNPNPPL